MLTQYDIYGQTMLEEIKLRLKGGGSESRKQRQGAFNGYSSSIADTSAKL